MLNTRKIGRNSVTESDENNNDVSIPITISAAAVMPEISNENQLKKATHFSEEIRVYPNPAKTQLTIDAGTFEWTQLAVLNLNGQLMKEFNASEYTVAVQIPVEDLEPGTYIIRLLNARDCAFVRVIAE